MASAQFVRGFFAALAFALLAAGSAAQAGETQTYTYDAKGRLVRVVTDSVQSDDWDVQIQYDDAGNRVAYASTNTTSGSGSGGGTPPSIGYSPRIVFNGRFFVMLVRTEG